MASDRFHSLIKGAAETLATAKQRSFEPASYTEIAAVFAELAKAEAAAAQADAVEHLAVELGRVANAVQQRR